MEDTFWKLCRRRPIFVSSPLRMKGVHPALAAFGVLVLVCFAGAYMLNRQEGFFDAASKSASAECEKTFQTCLKSTDLKTCTTNYNTCIGKISNSSVSSKDNAASTGAAAGSTSAAAVKGIALCDAQLAVCKNQGGKDCDSSYATCKESVKGSGSGYGDLLKNALAGLGADESAYKTFLAAVQSKAATSDYPAPSTDQLSAAQGGDFQGDLGQEPAAYTPPKVVILPHQTPPAYVSQYVPTTGTGSSDSILSPSQRQNIRQEVKNIFDEESTSFANEYEIQYRHQ